MAQRANKSAAPPTPKNIASGPAPARSHSEGSDEGSFSSSVNGSAPGPGLATEAAPKPPPAPYLAPAIPENTSNFVACVVPHLETQERVVSTYHQRDPSNIVTSVRASTSAGRVYESDGETFKRWGGLPTVQRFDGTNWLPVE